MERYTARTAEEMEALAPKIIAAIGTSRVIAMDAPMGAGKTTLVKAIGKALGSPSVVNSPTFAIVNDYELPDGTSMYHFDLYRLRDASEAYGMGFDEYFDSGCYCFVEWPAVAESLLPDDARILRIEVGAEGERTITIE